MKHIKILSILAVLMAACANVHDPATSTAAVDQVSAPTIQFSSPATQFSALTISSRGASDHVMKGNVTKGSGLCYPGEAGIDWLEDKKANAINNPNYPNGSAGLFVNWKQGFKHGCVDVTGDGTLDACSAISHANAYFEISCILADGPESPDSLRGTIVRSRDQRNYEHSEDKRPYFSVRKSTGMPIFCRVAHYNINQASAKKFPVYFADSRDLVCSQFSAERESNADSPLVLRIHDDADVADYHACRCRNDMWPVPELRENFLECSLQRCRDYCQDRGAVSIMTSYAGIGYETKKSIWPAESCPAVEWR